MTSRERAELIEVVRAWDESMVANNSLAIGSFMTEDWIIIGPDGSVEGRERFLGLIASGDLSHDTMTSEDLIIRVLGDSAIVVARGVSAGIFRGRRFQEQERRIVAHVDGEDQAADGGIRQCGLGPVTQVHRFTILGQGLHLISRGAAAGCTVIMGRLGRIWGGAAGHRDRQGHG